MIKDYEIGRTIDAPYEEREIFDFFQIGCSMFEIITKQDASPSNEEFATFMASIQAA